MDDREVEALPDDGAAKPTSTQPVPVRHSLPGPACLSRRAPVSWAEQGSGVVLVLRRVAVARTCWARPALVRPVAWSTAAAASRQNSYPRGGAALLSACHGLAVAAREWGGGTGHYSGHPGRAGGSAHARPRFAAGGGLAAHMAPEAPVRRGRGVEAAEPQPLASGVRWPRGRYAVGGMVPHAALPPRGSDGASAGSNTDAPRDGLAHLRRRCPIGPSVAANLINLSS